jgi:hypothetical protein
MPLRLALQNGKIYHKELRNEGKNKLRTLKKLFGARRRRALPDIHARQETSDMNARITDAR